MKLAQSAFALSVVGLVACGVIAASAAVPLAGLTATGAIARESDMSRERPAQFQTAGIAPLTYYAVRTH